MNEATVSEPSVRTSCSGGGYFMVLWGFQGALNLPASAHSFASFYSPDDIERSTPDPLTLSWLPATGIVRNFLSEPGKNFSLSETLRIAHQRRARVAAYGPYEIKPELYRKASQRIDYLKSGALAFRMVNGSCRACNCIAALSEIGGHLRTGLKHGFSATEAIAEHLASWIYAYPKVHEDVANLIKIDAFSDRGIVVERRNIKARRQIKSPW